MLTLLSFSALQTAVAPSSLRLLPPNLCKDQGRHLVGVGYMLKFEFWANLLNFGQHGHIVKHLGNGQSTNVANIVLAHTAVQARARWGRHRSRRSRTPTGLPLTQSS